MSEAPARIWTWRGVEWYTEGVTLEGDETEYIRADIHQARVKELEAVVKKLWRRQDSLGTFDAAVNDILAPLFEKQTNLGTSATIAIFDDLVGLYEKG